MALCVCVAGLLQIKAGNIRLKLTGPSQFTSAEKILSR